MATGTGVEASTLTRADVLIRQLSMLVQSTTGSTTFKATIEKAINERWIKKVTISGLTKQGRIRQQIVVEIDWNEHLVRLKGPNQGEIEINLARSERNWVSKVIGQLIDGFNEITEKGDLEAVWAVTYTSSAQAKIEYVRKQLGLVSAKKRLWEDGRIELIIDQYRPRKLSEMEVSWKVVTKR